MGNRLLHPIFFLSEPVCKKVVVNIRKSPLGFLCPPPSLG